MKLVHGVLSAAAMAASAAIALPGAAYAQEVSFSGNIALTTDYAFRGISQTDENAAVQGGFDAAYGQFYAGTWASNINFGTGGANMELDVYGGYKPVVGPVTLDLGIIGYLYPGAHDPTAELDYWEGYVKGTIAPTEKTTLGLSVFYSPEFTGESGDGWYVEANGSAALTDAISVSGAVGYQTVDQAGFFFGEDNYTTWNLGGTYSAGGFGFDLRYVGTDIDNASIADDRVIFSIKRAL
jgi:uncharacterized protein (TIGR02001 family)